MAELELVCAVYGEGTVFSVVVARTAKVEALQEAIVAKKKDVNDRFRVDPAKVTLYVARDQRGAWLTDDDTLKELLQGKSEQQFKTMHSAWLLNDEEYFGEETPPTSKAVHVLVELPQTAPSSTGLWLVRGSVTHALSTKGVRCRLYRLAGLNLGYYDPARRDGDKESALWYDGTTLRFHLLFETKQDALLFENAVMDEKLMQGSPLNTQEVETRVTRVGAAATEPKRVFFADYDPQDSESLQESISSLFSSTSVTVVDPDTDEFRYQRIEGEDIFTPYVKAESCRLVSRKLCHEKSEFSKYDRDPNNRLALSREMHGYYDGMSCTIPLIAIRPGTIDRQPSIGDRIKVEVFVRVFDAQCTARVFNRLKVGSCKTDDPLTRKTYVHVKDPATFVRCLEWKWAETQERWDSFLSMTPAVD